MNSYIVINGNKHDVFDVDLPPTYYATGPRIEETIGTLSCSEDVKLHIGLTCELFHGKKYSIKITDITPFSGRQCADIVVLQDEE